MISKRLHFNNDIIWPIIVLFTDPRDKTPACGFPLSPTVDHEYKFHYALPSALPSTFESHDVNAKGRVHYIIRAKLDSPDDAVKQNLDKVIVVLSELDLNIEDRVQVAQRPYSLCTCNYCSVYIFIDLNWCDQNTKYAEQFKDRR